MIAQLTGLVVRSEGSSVILDVNGVGYQVFVPATVLSHLPDPGGKCTLLTHLIVREEEMSLYGFSAPAEIQAFKILLGVSGVGPKVGLALLSMLSVSELARAISGNDAKSITKAPGVGPKLAQRICLELGDRMAAFAFEQTAEQAAGGERTAQENAAYEDAIEGMVSLGYSRADARRAVDRVFADAPDRADPGALINGAMRMLTGAKR